MIIETWRWRFVMLCLGLVLLGTGLYSLLHPGEVPLNICYSQTSRILQTLNTVASIATFLVVTGAGGAIVFLVGYSVKEGLSIQKERKPVEIRRIIWVILGNLAILIALAVCVLLAQWLLKGISLNP